MTFRCIALSGVFAVHGALGQAVTIGKLPGANGRLAEEFTVIGSVRELSDGRVLINDPRDNRLVVADFKTGAVTQIGRPGRGPAEYERALPVYGTAGDSSLMIDGMGGRWLILDGAKIVGSVPPDAPFVRRVGSGGLIYGADRYGNVLGNHSPPLNPRGYPIKPADSSYSVLISVRTGRVDTIARLWLGPPYPAAEANATGVRYYNTRPFSTYDRQVLATDGWVAILRMDPYRVDWRTSAGKWIFGEPIRVPDEPVTQKDKDAFIARISGGRAGLDASAIDWPKNIPAHVGGLPPLATSDGMLAVPRTTSAAFPQRRYDIIDRQGRLRRQIALAGDQQYIVGFGRRSVYVIVKDADEILRLQRHPWP